MLRREMVPDENLSYACMLDCYNFFFQVKVLNICEKICSESVVLIERETDCDS